MKARPKIFKDNSTREEIKRKLLLSRRSVGLPAVDNTSDEDKPVSSATQSALDKKADERDMKNLLIDNQNLKLVLSNLTDRYPSHMDCPDPDLLDRYGSDRYGLHDR